MGRSRRDRPAVPILLSLVAHLATLLVLACVALQASPSRSSIDLDCYIEDEETPPISFLKFDDPKDAIPDGGGSTNVDPATQAATLAMSIADISLVEIEPKAIERPPKTADHTGGRGLGVGKGTGTGRGRTVGGIPVNGSVTLVCDVSGSMHHDLPKLLKELSVKFPGSLVITVSGCQLLDHSSRGDAQIRMIEEAIEYAESLGRDDLEPKIEYLATLKSTAEATQEKLSRIRIRSDGRRSSSRGSLPRGVEIMHLNLRFRHVNGVPEALRFAAQQSTAGTIFNCDLQDGWCERFMAEIADLYQSQGKTLSIRSLHFRAPPKMISLLRSTGGTFRHQIGNRIRHARSVCQEFSRPQQANPYIKMLGDEYELADRNTKRASSRSNGRPKD